METNELKNRAVKVIDAIAIGQADLHALVASEKALAALEGTRARLRGAFGELDVTVKDQVAEGSVVVTRAKLKGAHVGVLDIPGGHLAPTGNAISTSASIALTFDAAGKVVGFKALYDFPKVLAQMGAQLVIPAAGARS